MKKETINLKEKGGYMGGFEWRKGKGGNCIILQ